MHLPTDKEKFITPMSRAVDCLHPPQWTLSTSHQLGYFAPAARVADMQCEWWQTDKTDISITRRSFPTTRGNTYLKYFIFHAYISLTKTHRRTHGLIRCSPQSSILSLHSDVDTKAQYSKIILISLNQAAVLTSDAYCCHMAMKHPVPDQVKSSFVIFDIRALWRSALSFRVPGCPKLQMTA